MLAGDLRGQGRPARGVAAAAGERRRRTVAGGAEPSAGICGGAALGFDLRAGSLGSGSVPPILEEVTRAIDEPVAVQYTVAVQGELH
jgi:hypothetical protein